MTTAIEVQDKRSAAMVGFSSHDATVEYRKGATVRADAWDDDRWNTCSYGIHFFLTKIEAENY